MLCSLVILREQERHVCSHVIHSTTHIKSKEICKLLSLVTWSSLARFVDPQRAQYNAMAKDQFTEQDPR